MLQGIAPRFHCEPGRYFYVSGLRDVCACVILVFTRSKYRAQVIRNEEQRMTKELEKVTAAATILQNIRIDADEALRQRNEAIEAALDAGVGQTAIAAAAGTSQAVVSRIEKARHSEGAAS